jgi:hypothetical protein
MRGLRVRKLRGLRMLSRRRGRETGRGDGCLCFWFLIFSLWEGNGLLDAGIDY